MEFRASFLTQMVAMMINNAVWIAFWGIYFTKFPVVNGWELRDILILWGIATGGYGWSMALFGNTLRLAPMIATGQVDYYLTLPKNVLLHMLISRMSFSAWGDYVFSWIMLFIAGGLSIGLLAKYLLAQLIVGVLFIAVFILAHALTFFFGNAEGLAQQFCIAMVTFVTYPIDIFKGFTKVLLFIALPAGFISSMPITLFKSFNALYFSLTLFATAGFVALALFVFYRGLKRYESGNMITLRM